MTNNKSITLSINVLYEGGTAKLDQIETYITKSIALTNNYNIVTLTGPGPVWLYLKLAHALHGKVTTLYYESPVTGPVQIFDHNPF